MFSLFTKTQKNSESTRNRATTNTTGFTGAGTRPSLCFYSQQLWFKNVPHYKNSKPGDKTTLLCGAFSFFLRYNGGQSLQRYINLIQIKSWYWTKEEDLLCSFELEDDMQKVTCQGNIHSNVFFRWKPAGFTEGHYFSYAPQTHEHVVKQKHTPLPLQVAFAVDWFTINTLEKNRSFHSN